MMECGDSRVRSREELLANTHCCMVIIIIIIIIIINHQLSLDRPVSASSKSQLKGLPTPFGLFSITFDILMLLILVICRDQFDFCFLSFSSSSYAFDCFKISSFFCGQKGCTFIAFFSKGPNFASM
jgi:hypothetical protein